MKSSAFPALPCLPNSATCLPLALGDVAMVPAIAALRPFSPAENGPPPVCSSSRRSPPLHNSGGLTGELRRSWPCPRTFRWSSSRSPRATDRHYTDAEARQHAPNILRFEGCHVGERRLLFKITFARQPVFDTGGLLLYADLDCDRQTGRQDSPSNRGVDVTVGIHGTQVEISFPNTAFHRQNTAVPAAKIVGNELYITLNVPLKIEAGKVRLDVSLLSERWGGRSDSTPRRVAEFPYFAERTVPRVVQPGHARPAPPFRLPLPR